VHQEKSGSPASLRGSFIWMTMNGRDRIGLPKKELLFGKSGLRFKNKRQREKSIAASFGKFSISKISSFKICFFSLVFRYDRAFQQNSVSDRLTKKRLVSQKIWLTRHLADPTFG
jgi:hypothetical protein